MLQIMLSQPCILPTELVSLERLCQLVENLSIAVRPEIQAGNESCFAEQPNT